MISGIVVHGEGLGRGLGYPTANLNISPKDTKCKDGVYAAKALLKNKHYKAALIIQEEVKKVEVYLFDYTEGDFYGLYMEVEPIQKVSEIEAYAGEDQLKKKIEKDIQLIKEIF